MKGLFRILLLISISQIYNGQVLQDIARVIAEGEETCDVEGLNVYNCVDQTGDPFDLGANLKRLPIGCSCKSLLEGDKVRKLTCMEDSIILQEPSKSDSNTNTLLDDHHKRNKRGFWKNLWHGITNFAKGTACIVTLGLACESADRGHGTVVVQPVNQPPTLHCPVVNPEIVTVNASRDTAVVKWNPPTATDKETKAGHLKITQSPESTKPNRAYREGRYSVIFMAEDTMGGSTTCTMTFEVKVIRCLPPRWPAKGNLKCNYEDYRAGTICSVECDNGYVVDGSGQSSREITCSKRGMSGQWNGPVRDCAPKSCDLTSIPTIPGGQIECPENEFSFGTTCSVVCNQGFKRTGQIYFIRCHANGTWDSPRVACVDATPPEFDMKTCPENIVVSTDSVNNTALVNWLPPIGSDNVDGGIVITEASGYMPNTPLAAGTHLLRYTITDKAGNRGRTCGFSIKVLAMSCGRPFLQVEGASHMMYECPLKYRYGAECQLTCRSGYPLVGADKIQCLKEDENADPPKLNWTWPPNQLKPYCKESVCEDLQAPKHGATVCDKWVYGRTCQIQCDANWDFAFNFPDIYVCGTNNGQWRPHNIVPDCIRKVSAHHVHMMAEVYYYTGACNSSRANLQQIKNNFIRALNSSQYASVCVNEPFCTADYVNVTCGSTSRRKRDTQHHDILRRSTRPFAYKVVIDLTVSLTSSSASSSGMVFALKANILSQMAMKIEEELQKGHFGMPGLDMHIESDSFYQGLVEYKCPKGMQTRMTSGSCAGCPVGMFMSEANASCVSCPVGTYQDTINSVDCKICPQDTNTLAAGSVNISQCISVCSPGSFSKTGLEPCSECTTAEYQPRNEQTSCLSCDRQTRTLSPGAISKSHCQAYDIMTNKVSPLVLQYATAQSDVLAYSSWIFIRASNTTEELFTLSAVDGSSAIALNYNGSLDINVNGQSFATGVSMHRRKWIHLALVVDGVGSVIRIYKYGALVHRKPLPQLPYPTSYSAGARITIKADIHMSSFYLLETNVSSSTIHRLSSSCTSRINGSIFTLDDISSLVGAKIIMPSMCDDIDNCIGNPCGANECIDKIGGYDCVCRNGYSGSKCQTLPDFCLQNSCQNGATCVTGQTNYTCSCPYGFHGALCESKAVDGKWSSWSTWSSCTVSCGGGRSFRNRRCDSPPPDSDGQPCVGTTNDTKSCNTAACPECPRLRRSFGAVFSCNDTMGLKKCSLSCRPGLYPSTPPLLSYECGELTNYKWNQQTPLNPTGRLPSCTYVKPPDQVVVKISGEYLVFPCDYSNTTNLSSGLVSQLNNVSCATSGNCTVVLASEPCPHVQQGRGRRSLPANMPFTIDIKMDIDSTDYSTGDIEQFVAKRIASAGLMKLFQQVKILEDDVKKIFQISARTFHSSVSQSNDSFGSDLLKPTTTLVCPAGSVPLDLFCAVSPVGTFVQNDRIVFCPVGEFQDEPGRLSCKSCPPGSTTYGVGAENSMECV